MSMPSNLRIRKPRLLYVSNTRLPTEKPHGLALVKLCEAFADIGLEVTVIAPKLWHGRKDDVFRAYDSKRNFSIITLPTIDLIAVPFLRRWTFLFQMITFSLSAFIFLMFRVLRKGADEIIFSHDYMPLWALSFLKNPIFYDIHHFPGKNFMYRRVMRQACGFSVQTKWKIAELQERFGIAKEKILYWPNGTDVEQFSIEMNMAEARAKLGIETKGPLVLYTGQLLPWKGVDTLVRTLEFLLEGISLYVVGGSVEDELRLRTQEVYGNDIRIQYVPPQPHTMMPVWMKAADVLVLPNTGTQKVSRYYTSPMKLFEYMASGRPIVASDIPSVREILDDSTAFFGAADNPRSFAEQIISALQDKERARAHTRAAHNLVSQYTWRERAERIAGYIQRILTKG